MCLTSKNLIAFSKFAQKAKKHLGLIKSVEMFNDPQYASNTLIQATLSDDDELVLLSKMICNEFKADIRLIRSVETYISELKTKNNSAEFLHENKYYLVKLTHHLSGVKVDGASYRESVEKLLLEVESKKRSFCINLARAFYPMWRNAYRSHKEKEGGKGLHQSIEKENLIKLWNHIDEEFFSDAESWSLNIYIQSMRQIKVSEKDINIRSKIAKLITITLRNEQNKFKVNYRSAVKTVEFMFTSQELKEFYLMVCREYYQFWIGDIPKLSNE